MIQGEEELTIEMPNQDIWVITSETPSYLRLSKNGQIVAYGHKDDELLQEMFWAVIEKLLKIVKDEIYTSLGLPSKMSDEE